MEQLLSIYIVQQYYKKKKLEKQFIHQKNCNNGIFQVGRVLL